GDRGPQESGGGDCRGSGRDGSSGPGEGAHRGSGLRVSLCDRPDGPGAGTAISGRTSPSCDDAVGRARRMGVTPWTTLGDEPPWSSWHLMAPGRAVLRKVMNSA